MDPRDGPHSRRRDPPEQELAYFPWQETSPNTIEASVWASRPWATMSQPLGLPLWEPGSSWGACHDPEVGVQGLLEGQKCPGAWFWGALWDPKTCDIE